MSDRHRAASRGRPWDVWASPEISELDKQPDYCGEYPVSPVLVDRVSDCQTTLPT